MKHPADLKVFISNSESACTDCGKELGERAWFFLTKRKEALCLSCADLDHLVFLSSGDAALTRRARKHSTLSTVVLKWSDVRQRYERQGLLVEYQALEVAEEECMSDNEVKARRKTRESARVKELDKRYVETFTSQVRELFPGCPKGRETIIAEHAYLKHNSRVGLGETAEDLDEEAVRAAVMSHVRHAETEYDILLARGYEQRDARDMVENDVCDILEEWENCN